MLTAPLAHFPARAQPRGDPRLCVDGTPAPCPPLLARGALFRDGDGWRASVDCQLEVAREWIARIGGVGFVAARKCLSGRSEEPVEQREERSDAARASASAGFGRVAAAVGVAEGLYRGGPRGVLFPPRKAVI